jgi:hypothetical protein
MQPKLVYPVCGAALAALVLTSCYVATAPDPQQSGAHATTPPPRQPSPYQPQPGDVEETTPPPHQAQPTPPPRQAQPMPPPPPPPPVEQAPAEQDRPRPGAGPDRRDKPSRVVVRDRRGRLGRAASFAIEPTIGPAGTAVNIYGQFRPGARAKGPVECTFTGAKPVSPFYVSLRRMILIVPDGARTGPVRCAVGKQELWAGHFAVTPRLDDIFLPTTEEEGLLGAVYKLPPNTRRLPNFDTLGEPFATFVMPALQVLPREFKAGFPGLSTGGEPLLEWFAIRFVGQIDVTRTAEYAFRLTSDDGAKLYIDDQLVINNDGIHPPTAKEGTIHLTEGKHDIVVEYFQGPRHSMALLLQWKRGNNPFSAVAAKSLSRYTDELDCSERPMVFCCQANTPACQDCKARAQAAVDVWDRQCKGGPR